jgi:hypothetical protein
MKGMEGSQSSYGGYGSNTSEYQGGETAGQDPHVSYYGDAGSGLVVGNENSFPALTGDGAPQVASNTNQPSYGAGAAMAQAPVVSSAPQAMGPGAAMAATAQPLPGAGTMGAAEKGAVVASGFFADFKKLFGAAGNK